MQQWRQRTCPGGASGGQISTGQLRGQRGDWLLTAGNGVWEAAGAILVCADVAERAGTKGDHEEGPVYVDTPGGQKTRGTLEKACGGRRRVIDIISGGACAAGIGRSHKAPARAWRGSHATPCPLPRQGIYLCI